MSFIKKSSLLFLLLVFLFGPYDLVKAVDQAKEHIIEIGEAIDRSDAESFSQLVDMDTILNNALDVFIQEASKPENASRLPPMVALLLSQITKGASSPVRDLLLGEAKNFVLTGISSGAFAGQKPNLSNAQGLFAPIFASASLGRKEIKNIGAPRQIENGWIVPFIIFDHDNEYEYPVQGRLERSGDNLKLTGLENMRQLIYQIGQESEAVQQ